LTIRDASRSERRINSGRIGGRRVLQVCTLCPNKGLKWTGKQSPLEERELARDIKVVNKYRGLYLGSRLSASRRTLQCVKYNPLAAKLR
jgi:hypothetical protein